MEKFTPDQLIAKSTEPLGEEEQEELVKKIAVLVQRISSALHKKRGSPINPSSVTKISYRGKSWAEYISEDIPELYPEMNLIQESPNSEGLVYKLYQANPIKVMEYYLVIDTPKKIMTLWFNAQEKHKTN